MRKILPVCLGAVECLSADMAAQGSDPAGNPPAPLYHVCTKGQVMFRTLALYDMDIIWKDDPVEP